MSQRRTPQTAALCSSENARELPGGFLGRSILRVADHRCVFAGVGGVLYTPSKPAPSGPDCATKVAHKSPCGGLLMTRLRDRVDNPVDGRSLSRAAVGGEEVRAHRLH